MRIQACRRIVILLAMLGMEKASAFVRPSPTVRTTTTSPVLSLAVPEVVTDLTSRASSVLPNDLSPQLLVLDTWNSVPVAAKAAVALSPVAVVAQWLFQCVKTEKNRPTENTYPESTAATYDLSTAAFLAEPPFALGDAALCRTVRPLLKQTQLEYRALRVAYSANRQGYNAQAFHQAVDGQGAALVLAKVSGQWLGRYNPRGWASLGGSRPSRAAFLFYQTGAGSWQKLRVLGGGGMSCGNDLRDSGIYLGAEGLVIPLDSSSGNPRNVKSRLGTYFETKYNRGTLLPRAGVDARVQELHVLVGVYDNPDDIPNSGGVLDLGLY